LEGENINLNVINRIIEVINEYPDSLIMTEYSINENELEEIQEMAEQIIKRTYRDWMVKEKTKIRCNFANDAKRTWNRIKQPIGQATKITPDDFANHYAENWELNQKIYELMTTHILLCKENSFSKKMKC
jgi:hypothetical protein